MKTFKQLFEAPGAPAQDNKRVKDDDEEVKGYKPRSKGEEDFADQHTTTKTAHPVATDAQFTGNVSKGNPDNHVGNKKHASGEEKPVMQGSSKIKESFSSFMGLTDGDN